MINILVPIDFSDLSREALRHAEHVARAWGGRLHLVSVVEELYALNVQETYAEVQAVRLRDQFEEVRPQLEGVDPLFEVRTGKPADEILKMAEQIPSDLIVIATHGRTGLARLVMGSVAEAVIRSAPCPVLTVNGPMKLVQLIPTPPPPV